MQFDSPLATPYTTAQINRLRQTVYEALQDAVDRFKERLKLWMVVNGVCVVLIPRTELYNPLQRGALKQVLAENGFDNVIGFYGKHDAPDIALRTTVDWKDTDGGVVLDLREHLVLSDDAENGQKKKRRRRFVTKREREAARCPSPSKRPRARPRFRLPH